MTDMRIMSELLFDEAAFQSTHDFVLAFSNHALPILVDSSDNVAIHIAAETFADDVERVTGTRPKVYKDELPKDAGGKAIIAATAGSKLLRSVQHAGVEDVRGKWECYDARLVQAPCKGVDQGLVIMGSDRRGVIFGLYTLSELMGVSPWYWWADVAVSRRSTVAFPRHLVLAHGEPTVKYRGFFLNDEQPVLWNWAKEHFKIPKGQPPFQVGMYEKVFELVLRLKGNYLWPAMWASMFAVDGQDVSSGLPSTPTPGPNQALADRMGVVMGTSHHEPMSRNQKEYTTWGRGDWNFETNEKWLTEFWKYGAERAKGLETLYTVGMRGDGDLPLDGANVPLLERITSVQQDILREVHDKKDLSDIPQLWAIYKEVMGYFASGLKVPEEVTALLADDNWGNLQAVMPTDRDHAGGGGIYYHADYVGDPRDYKWTNTVSLAKMWEQLNIARSFKTDRIWICNVGDLKVLETPLELFMSLAYDFDAIPRDGLKEYLAKKSKRDYGNGMEDEVADIMATYSIYASRRKAELVDSHTYSITTFDEAERVLKQWADLEERATRVYKQLPAERKSAFYQVVYSAILLNHNLNRLYISAAKSNLYATQGRAAANFHAQTALDCFERDWELTQEYHALEGGKWKHVLNQPHINYQYWQMPVRNSMPPISFISKHEPTYANEYVIHTRYTVEGSRGAWPGDNKFNCPLGYNCPDPSLAVMDRYGRPRWIEVGSGGPEDIEFTAEPVEEWMIVHPSKGKIKAGGADDVRVWISVDWDKVDINAKAGHVRLNSSDCAKTTVITLPLEHVQAPPHGFVGALQGDGYVAIEAAHCQELVSADKHSWAEVAHYGRTHSGMSLFPVSDVSFVSGKGPCMAYNVWITSLPSDTVTAILHIGPSLNFILGQRISFAVQMDDGDIKVVEPVPEAKLGDLPGDWEDIVAAEVREVRVNVMVKGTGKHVFKVWAITPGVVVERIMLDLGGIASREATYLGPPESIIL